MIDVSLLVIPRFHDALGDVEAHGHTHYWLHSGRGSMKSSFISVCIVLLLLLNPEANAVVARRFSNTLRDSVFSQLTWAIAALGLDAWFRVRISPMELAYLPTAQRIVFRGADDPLNLEGAKFARELRGDHLVRGARPVRWNRHGAEHPKLAAPRRERLLDLLQLQPAENAVVLGEPRGAGARAEG